MCRSNQDVDGVEDWSGLVDLGLEDSIFEVSLVNSHEDTVAHCNVECHA